MQFEQPLILYSSEGELGEKRKINKLKKKLKNMDFKFFKVNIYRGKVKFEAKEEDESYLFIDELKTFVKLCSKYKLYFSQLVSYSNVYNEERGSVFIDSLINKIIKLRGMLPGPDLVDYNLEW